MATEETRDDQSEREEAPEKLSPQMRADARRFAILELLLKKGRPDDKKQLIVGDVISDSNFARRFKKDSQDAIKENFREIQTLFSQPTVITSSGEVLESKPDQAFADHGYGKADLAKQAIAKLVVGEYLKEGKEICYLSTGTTVYETAVWLVNAVEQGEKPNIERILTDNLGIVFLFCRRAPQSEALRRIRFTIIGGVADFVDGDITLEATFAQLDRWKFSTAIVSATNVDPDSGIIYSFREPETKEKFYTSVNVSQLIIPVESKKITDPGGGRLIYNPQTMRWDATRKPIIATEELSDAIREKLERWYVVRVARPPRAP